ncbi:hypothetical protein [Aureispira anguillae]|uniref:hypothetical protein n=1 Tax=Aureispira anguillae TaxID=2864201 RepID=UPI0022303F58|nr:hypothetical protein [Aureispira anguillae]
MIKKHKRASLIKLYSYVKKHRRIEKERIFPHIFDQPYSSKKDALLRNELRLLNKELELFLVEYEWKKQLQLNSDQTQLSLIKIYLARKEYNLFEQLWRKLYKKAQKERLYTLKVELITLFFDYRLQRAEIDFDLYQEIKLLLEEALVATLAQMQENYKQLELKDAFIQRNLYALSGQTYHYQRIPSYYHTTQAIENDAVILYLEYSIQSYFSEGYEKIKLLQTAIAQSDSLSEHAKYQSLVTSPIMLKTSIGLEYFLLKEYQKADEIYTQVLAQEQLIPAQKKPGVYFNYVSNLIALGAYQRAIEWYESSSDDWKKIPQITYRIQYRLCWAYIMQKEFQKPLDLLLEHNIQQRPENDFIYARLLLTIIYHSNHQKELAEREVYNLMQNNRYKTPNEIFYADYSKLLYQHIQATNILDKKKRNTKLQQIQNTLDSIYYSNANTISTMFYEWLTQQNEQTKL